MHKNKKTRSAKAADVVKASSPPLETAPTLGPWYLRSLTLSLLGAVLFFFSFSPYGVSLLGWVCTIPFLILVRQKRLLGKRPYHSIWFAAALAWLVMLEGIRRPFWALYFGWFALSIYAAAYIPLFVGASRILVHRWRWPLAVAAPVVWIGLELLRGYAFSGFSVGLLAHTQFQNPLVIQIADLFGQCGVSFLVIAPAAALVSLLPRSWIDGNAFPKETSEPLAPRLICAVAVSLLLVVSFAYGQHRLTETDAIAKNADTLKVVLIQGNTDVIFGGDSREYIDSQFRKCRALTTEALDQHPETDIVIWPESCFLAVGFDIRVNPPVNRPAHLEITSAEYERGLTDELQGFASRCEQFVERFKASAVDQKSKPLHSKFLLGSGTFEIGPGDREVGYNSAIFLDDQGKIESRYFKMHRVMFGEYIPIVDLFPILYRFTPLPAGIRAGDKPSALRVKKWVLSPNICFESTVPQLVRGQSINLAKEMAPPDALVNLTNDGWFWGSGVQDLHLHCAIFRAVENRRPFIVAANSGFSVHCDAAGRILALGKRRKAEALPVTLTKDSRITIYHQWGDWPVSLCLLAVVAALVLELLVRRGYLQGLTRE